MSYTIIIIGLCLIFAMVVGIVNYYGNRKTSPWYLRLLVTIGVFFPFSIVLILPLDISSSIYRNLSEEEKLITKPPIGYQSEEFFTFFWNITYWTSYALTWLFLPLLSGYILSGYFTPLTKFKDSIYQNLIFYGACGGVGVIFVIYIAIAKKMTGKAILGFLMALSNAWGLLLCIIFLGYGLVDVPRRILRKSNLTWVNNYNLFKAQAYKEATLEANEELQNVVKKIFRASNEISSRNPIRVYADRLIEMCPITQNSDVIDTYDDNNHAGFDGPNIKLKYLASLNYDLKRAILKNNRCIEQYDELIKKAIRTQDIIQFEDNPNQMVELPIISRPDSRFANLKYKIAWWWYFKVRRYMLIFFATIPIFLSLSILWSEMTFQFTNSNFSLFYIFLKYSKYISYAFFELITVLLLLYMTYCTYTSLFRLQLFEYYRLFPHHHTDNNSLVFCTSYLCRLIYPLCYNFLYLTDNSQTAYSKIMGKIEFVPLLGKEFNYYVPILMIVFTVVTFFNIHYKVLKYFGIDKHFGIDHFSIENEDDMTDIQDGRILIDQARRRSERNNLPNFYNSIDYGTPISNKNQSYIIQISSPHSTTANNSNNTNNHNNNNKRLNVNTNLNSDSASTHQNSAYDYPFHFKNLNNPYAAPSSADFSHPVGSYSSNSNSTLYSGSGSGHHPQNQTSSFYAPSASSQNNRKPSSNAPSSTASPTFSKHKRSPSPKKKSKQQQQQTPKKKFGFNIQTNPEAFYSPYQGNSHLQHPPIVPSSSSNAYTSYSTPATPTSPTSTHSNSTTHSNTHPHVSTKNNLHVNTYGLSSYSRKYGSNNNSPLSSGVKSKTRKFGLNYKLNG